MNIARIALTSLALSSTAFADELNLSVDSILEPGEPVVITVTGAFPGQTVYVGVAAATLPDALCPAVLNGLCIDLVDPRLIVQGLADANGELSLTAQAPNTPDGEAFTFQAAARGARKPAQVSNTVTRYNPLSTYANRTNNGSAAYDFFGGHVIDSRATSPFGLVDIDVTRADGLDVCAVSQVWNGAATTVSEPCPECEFAFDFVVADVTDRTLNGDCAKLLGVEATDFFSTGIAIGFDEDASFGSGAYGQLMFYYVPGAPGYWIPAGPGYLYTGSPGVEYFYWAVSNSSNY